MACATTVTRRSSRSWCRDGRVEAIAYPQGKVFEAALHFADQRQRLATLDTIEFHDGRPGLHSDHAENAQKHHDDRHQHFDQREAAHAGRARTDSMKVGYEHDVDWVTARPLAEMQTQRLTLADGTLSLIEDEPPEVRRPEELKTNSRLLARRGGGQHGGGARLLKQRDARSVAALGDLPVPDNGIVPCIREVERHLSLRLSASLRATQSDSFSAEATDLMRWVAISCWNAGAASAARTATTAKVTINSMAVKPPWRTRRVARRTWDRCRRVCPSRHLPQ